MASPSSVDNSADNSGSPSESSESSSESEGLDIDWSGVREERVEENGTRQPLLGKRRTSQPTKYSQEFPTGTNPKKRRTRQKKTIPSDPSNPSPSEYIMKRGRSCGKCDGCTREDCGKCQFCLDKPKFGGPGRKKQRCEKRPCTNFRKRGCSNLVFQRLSERMKFEEKVAATLVEKNESRSENATSAVSSTTTAPAVSVTVTSALGVTPSGLSTVIAPSTAIKPPQPLAISTISSSMLTPIAHQATPVKTLASVIEVLSSSKTPAETPASVQPALSVPTLMTVTPPVLSSVLTDAGTQDRLKTARQTIASNKLNIAEVSKKVAETRKLIQDTLKANPPPSTTSGLTISSSPVGPLTKTPSVMVTPLKPTADVLVSGKEQVSMEPSIPPRITPIQQSTSAPALGLLTNKGSVSATSMSILNQPKPLCSKESLASGSLKKILATVDTSSQQQSLSSAVSAPPPPGKALEEKTNSAGSQEVKTNSAGSVPNPDSTGVKTATAGKSILKLPSVLKEDSGVVKTPVQHSLLDRRTAKKPGVSAEGTPAKRAGVSSEDPSKMVKISPDVRLTRAQAQNVVSKPSVVKAIPRAAKRGLNSPAKPVTRKTLAGDSISRGGWLSDLQGVSSPYSSDQPIMKCIQCGRKGYVCDAHSTKFCTSHCSDQWLQANPGKTLQDDVPPKTTPTPAAKAPDSSSRGIPRALKNLQIDMAKPGTKLDLSMESASSSSSSTSDGEDEEDKVIRKPMVEQQKTSSPVDPKVPARGPVRRSTAIPQASAAKRQKISARSSAPSQKSVSFNLSGQMEMAPTPPPTSIPVLDKIASYFLPKKGNEVAQIPPGLPSDVRQWSVAQVVEYFKSTSDCKGYVELFDNQEVDGIALLLLSHETLVKCLGIKLGRAVKIMNRVQELKAYQEQRNKKTET